MGSYDKRIDRFENSGLKLQLYKAKNRLAPPFVCHYIIIIMQLTAGR